MTSNICNRLEKLVPPSFVTTGSSDRRSVILFWSTLVLKSKYETFKDLLNSEITILSGYIERKGTQLRLEKALITRQIQKVAQRWRLNDFSSQLKQFQNSIGIFDDKSGCLVKPDSSSSKREERLPSSQWLNWIIYLALRDSALLAKITIECENTIKFWLGLIASSHHWGDSLVICGILSRIWFLSSNLLQDLIQIIYPTLLQVSSCLKPNRSGSWPRTKFLAPSDLYKWILQDMKLPYRPVDFTTMDFKVATPRKNTSTSSINFSFLSNYFQKDDDNDNDDEVEGSLQQQSPKEDELETLLELKSSEHGAEANLNRPSDEDLGMVVERTVPKTSSKKKRKLQKNKTGNSVIEKKKKMKRMKKEAEDDEDLGMVVEQSISETPPPKKKRKLQKKKTDNRVIKKKKKKIAK